MSQPNDTPTDISLSAKLDSTGLSANVKSRTANAIDRLVGNFVDWGATYPERKAARARLEASHENKVLDSEFNAALRQLEANPDFGRRIADRVIHEQLRKQKNREEIVLETIEQLRLTSPSSDNDASFIDEDWMNQFERYAEDVSDKEIRFLWAKLLSAKINNENSVSKKTLSIIYVMDKNIAEKFEKIIQHRLNNAIFKPENMEGEFLSDLLILEDLGLIYGVHGMLNISYNFDANGFCYLAGQNYALQYKPISSRFGLPVIQISKSGMEIIKSIGSVETYEAVENFAQNISPKMSHIAILKIISSAGEKLQGNILKTIKSE